MKFTKHFYIEGQRIVSKLGDMGENQALLNPRDTARAGNNGNRPIDWDNKHEHLKDILIANFEELGLTGAVFTAGKSGKVPYGQIKKYFRDPDSIFNGGGNDTISSNNGNSGNKEELLQFYYHPDHLGSSNYVTDVSGEVYQHMEYFPFGETFVEERTDAEYTNYLFNGKEFDEEIGLYYYGARYYDPRTSVWQSVDPMAEKYIYQSSYIYCSNNPLNRIDPDGMDEWEINNKGKVKWIKESEKHTLYVIDDEGKRTGNSVTVKDRKILDQLTKKRTDFNGKYAITTNKKDAFKVFKFAADNTDVEWGIDGYRTSEDNEYVVRTSHSEDAVTMSTSLSKYNEFDQIFNIHSHPAVDGTKGGSKCTVFGGDMCNIVDRYYRFQRAGMTRTDTWFKKDGKWTVFPKHYVYHKHSKVLYNYTPWKNNVYIRKISKASDMHRNLGF